ncbi:MAG TPA: DUF2147 domain-containing protein [Bacteroidales bacterium]|nr:DUF2147 domain-containing protein [Bacteroidales bacterium]
MKKTGLLTFLFLALILLPGLRSIAQTYKADDILGIWYNGEKTSKLQIYKENNKYFAKIVWLKTPDDSLTGKPRTDNLNPDEKLRQMPLLGLVVLKNFSFDGDNEWEGGTIYDPKNGKTYNCYIKFEAFPNLLKIRGYIGVSLLGRTTYWTKTILL